MVTKKTISLNSKHHFYQEVSDYSNLYLKMDKVEFRASNDGVLLKIPTEVWRELLKGWEHNGWPSFYDVRGKEESDEWLDTLDKRKEDKAIVKPIKREYNNQSADETVIFAKKKTGE